MLEHISLKVSVNSRINCVLKFSFLVIFFFWSVAPKKPKQKPRKHKQKNLIQMNPKDFALNLSHQIYF